MKSLKRIILLIVIFIVFVGIKYILIMDQYKEVVDSGGYNNWRMTQRPLYSTNSKIEFLIDEAKELELKLWWRSLTGSIEVKITDNKGNLYFSKKASQVENKYSIPLNEGKYKMEIAVSNFSGAAALGYENIIIVNEFPNNNYSIIPSNPAKGFKWEYILYIPDKVKANKLLVVPNNTGNVSDNINIHKEKAKELILYKSELAEELGVPLLVPIFPRPKAYEELYTHALDRETILTNISELKRLDLQLIAMIDDCKEILSKKRIKIDEKILIAGFSASGDFVDRFTFLHPEIIRAAFIGGSDNIIPYENFNKENMPYPLGVYDYEKITGEKFSIDLIADINRYIYKGSEDEGGWQIYEENGKVTTYTGKEYFEKFEVRQLIDSLKQRNIPIYVDGDITSMKEISFRAYNGKILIDRFLLIKDIFDRLNLGKSEFVIYEGVGHEITKEIRQDELEFFNKILKESVGTRVRSIN